MPGLGVVDGEAVAVGEGVGVTGVAVGVATGVEVVAGVALGVATGVGVAAGVVLGVATGVGVAVGPGESELNKIVPS